MTAAANYEQCVGLVKGRKSGLFMDGSDVGERVALVMIAEVMVMLVILVSVTVVEHVVWILATVGRRVEKG